MCQLLRRDWTVKTAAGRGDTVMFSMGSTELGYQGIEKAKGMTLFITTQND